MPKTIKTRKTVKGVKTINRAANLSSRMKNAAISTKQRAEETQTAQHNSPSEYASENLQTTAERGTLGGAHNLTNAPKKAKRQYVRARKQFGKVKAQSPTARTRTAENAEKVFQSAANNADKLRTTAEKSQQTAKSTKSAVKNAKDTLKQVRRDGLNAVREAKRGAKTVRTKATRTTMKSTHKGVKKTAKGTIKTARKTVKTAERSAKSAVKTAQRTAKTAQQSATVAVKAAKVAERTARAAAKVAAKTAKAAAKGVMAIVKASIVAIKGSIAAIAAGGWVAVLVILIICLIGLLVGSVFGIFFSSEPSNSGQTINSTIAEIDAEYHAQIEQLKANNPHDLLDMSGARAAWKDVLAIYTVTTVTDTENPMEVATMNSAKAALLRAVFWEMNAIDHEVDTVEVEQNVVDSDGLPTGETVMITQTVLRIVVTHKSADEMSATFNDEQNTQLVELLKPEYHGLWNELLYGVATIGDGSLLNIATSQLGNVGGEAYWRWYGFDERVDWCAVFVSWVAEQSGTLGVTVPRFAAVSTGVQWYNDRDLWRDNIYTPSAGDIIFFDWEPDGSANHVGIVEYVADGMVYTIEGNTSDTVGRCSYELGSVKVIGYGINN